MTLPRKDQSDLMWFLGEGQTVCERSPTGQQLAVAETYAVAGTREEGMRAGVCIHCDGDGCEECEWTGANGAVYSTGQEPEYRETPHDPALLRYAAVSRRLLRMRPRGLAVVLCAYWGTEGDRWGRRMRGRVWAIISLTLEGQKKTPEQWDHLVQVQAQTPDLDRGRELARVTEAAYGLLRDAEDEWLRLG